MKYHITTDVEVAAYSKVVMDAEQIAKTIYALRTEMNGYVDRIDAGLVAGDIREANLGKRKLSGVVKRFGDAINEYRDLSRPKIKDKR